MCDHVIEIRISCEVAWQRRLARALSMAAGAQDASGMDNYEQLHVYAVEEDYAKIRADAAAAVAAHGGAAAVYPAVGAAAAKTTADLSGAAGEYDWLRLYFDEVIWPEAMTVGAHVEARRQAASVDVHSLDGDRPTADVEADTRRVILRVLTGDLAGSRSRHESIEMLHG